MEVTGTDNFIAAPRILKAIMEVVAGTLSAELNEKDVLGGKIDRMREWRFPEKGLDYGFEKEKVWK